MINIRTLKKLADNDGLTLKRGKAITYKSGWQVATEGQETRDKRHYRSNDDDKTIQW